MFTGSQGEGLCISLIDLGTHFKFISCSVECFNSIPATPYLTIATQYWQPKLGLTTGNQKWIEQGGSHHIILSLHITFDQLQSLCNMFNWNILNYKACFFRKEFNIALI